MSTLNLQYNGLDSEIDGPQIAHVETKAIVSKTIFDMELDERYVGLMKDSNVQT